MIKVAIVGANGYTGLELMKLLGSHKHTELVHAVSRSNVGVKISNIYPSLSNVYGDKSFCDLNVAALKRDCDVVFTALPHSASAEIGGQLFDAGVKVIDLSADFRYTDIETYENTYKVKHPRSDLNKQAVYGLTEINRDKIKNSCLIGNPGCFTTCSILPLYPLIKENVISPKGIIIDAKSGTSGAGRKSEVDYGFCEVSDNFKAYAVATHRHTSEIEEKLSDKNRKVQLCFTPHLLPVKRGILATIYADCTAASEQVTAAYNKYYAGEKFINFMPNGLMPELKWAVGSNMCYIGFKLDTRLNKIIIVSVIDNLLKGASGQAIQNMNVMFNLNENEGLPTTACYL